MAQLHAFVAAIACAIASVGVAACGSASSVRATRAPAPRAPVSAEVAEPASGEVAREPRLTVTLEPVPDGAPPAIRVRVTALAPSGALAVWSLAGIARPAALRVADARGSLDPSVVDKDGRVLVSLAREPEGKLDVSYEVAARADSGDVRLDATRFRATGEPLMLLPDALDDRPTKVTLHIEAGAIGATGAASSFGVGDAKELRVPLRELRSAAYLAGPMGHAIFEAYEGHDEAAWVGYTAFDPRWVSAEVATLRSALGEYFRDKNALPFTLLLASERRAGPPFSIALRTRSLYVLADLEAPWAIAARVPVANAIVRRWIGGGVRVGPEDASREAEGYWFSEGVARFVAREVLFASGTMTPDEYADEVNMLLGVVWTSPHRAEPNEDLAAHARERGVLPLLAARGALYATRVDALVRRRSAGKRALRDGLRALLEEAATKRAALLPVDAWTALLAREVGPDEARVFQDAIQGGIDTPLPDDALGPCFARGKVRFEAYDVGFDEEPTATAGKITGLREGGAAARAGLREGDAVAHVRGATGKAASPVHVTVVREGREVDVSYRPVGAVRVGIGWVRRRGVPDSACVR